MSPELPGYKFRVAISGAGIAGLFLAITIGKYDTSIPIDVYEAHDSIETASAGIILCKETHEIITELGLLDDFKHIFPEATESIASAVVRRADIPGGGYTWYQKEKIPNKPSATHRKDMVAILARQIPPLCTIHFRKRLIKYTEAEQEEANATSPIKLEFADGNTATSDVLVGADGIRSAVRKTLFEIATENKPEPEKGCEALDLKQHIEAIFTGMTMYRCLIDAKSLRKESPEHISFKRIVTYAGTGRVGISGLALTSAYPLILHTQKIVTYPIAKGTLINVVAIVGDPSLTGTDYKGHWTSEAAQDDLFEHFNDFEPDAKAILKLCEKPSKWALHVVKPLPFCVRKRVALIGDACHAMTPHFGAGAGQGIRDAFVLGRLIAHPLVSRPHINDILSIYEEIRLPLAREIANLSFSTGWMNIFMERDHYDVSKKGSDLDDRSISAYEREKMDEIKHEHFRRWDWMDNLKGALQEWKDAESKLQTILTSCM